MINKINALRMSILMCVATNSVMAQPLAAPEFYSNGPQQVSNEFSNAEMAAYALYESTMQVAEAAILATNCTSASGVYTFTVAADGALDQSASNQISVLSPGGRDSFVLAAKLNEPDPALGLRLAIEQIGDGSINRTPFSGVLSHVSFNEFGSMMVADTRVSVKGLNGKLDAFQGKVIKDFYKVPGDPDGIEPPYILDWGTQEISKLNFPLNKYWQRSKAIRSNGISGRTVFVKDRLTGSSACRIVMESTGFNNMDFFLQAGTLTISTETPSDPVEIFDSF